MDGPESLDFLQIWSLMLAYQNLYENRAQNRANDVGAANDAQAKYLLEELGRKFDEQNEMLKRILEVLSQ